MIERVIFTPEADDDVAGSYDWYESQEPGLGEDLLRSVEACVRGMQRHPEMYAAAIDEFRRAPIRRFPFESSRPDHFYDTNGCYLWQPFLLTGTFRCLRCPQLT